MKTLFYFVLLLFSLVACNNDDDNTPTNPIDQLPPETQTGANTFGCLINGEPFIVSNTNYQTAMYQQGVLFIAGQKNVNTSPTHTHISILVEEVISGEQTFTLNSNIYPKGEYYADNCFHFTTSTYTGILEITRFDTVNYVISGTFEFQAIADDCGNGEVINITDGRFDMQYIP